ncbi:hypothetical protein Pint_11204 [Pistacia integerrima]|uniref:Uncharacterized protein n=1 Tax=Pistacia integerrima TaxID=434235 RepID=A0ACC0XJU0_9ROSI|nr:hypothetical protein Pint_11204 [Pistacia integerrima]
MIWLSTLQLRVELVTLMFGKNKELLSIRGHMTMLPIHIAAQGGHKVSGSKNLPHEKLPSKALKLAKLLLDKVDCRDNKIDDAIKVAVEEENIEF